MQAQHGDGRRAIEQEQRMAVPGCAHAGADEQRQQEKTHYPARPHPAPGERDGYKQVTPPLFPHLCADDAADQWIKTSVLADKPIALVAPDVKETARCVIDKSMHRIRAVDRIERKLAEARRAERKGLEELA